MLAISDATGETAEQSCRAALAQFGHFEDARIRMLPHILNERALERAVIEAKEEKALLVYTLVGAELRARVKVLVNEHDVGSVDLLGPLVTRLGKHLGQRPLAVPGLGHELDEDYFRRIEAVEFAVSNDDGRRPDNLRKAELVIVGISRTSKTPLSNYIAHRGYRVANVPIVLDMPPPPQLDSLDPQRVFGLTIDPVTLMKIRQARMAALKMESTSDYGDLRQIRREITYARKLFDRHPGWTVIEVSRKAIEETASLILETYRQRFESPSATADTSEREAR